MRRWRLIDSGPGDAFRNMALDEAIALAVRGGMPPTLRVYGWLGPSVSIGCFQRAAELDLAYCAGRGIPVVRRPTGGRAILHQHELTYSFSAGSGEGLFSGGLLPSYRRLSGALSRAFSLYGLPARASLARQPSGAPRSPLCFQATSYGEITVEGRKVAGSAQKRWRDGLLQQGSIPFRVDGALMKRVFRLERDGALRGIEELVPGLGPEALKEALRTAFEEEFQVALIEARPTEQEETQAGELLRKYRSRQWTLRR